MEKKGVSVKVGASNARFYAVLAAGLVAAIVAIVYMDSYGVPGSDYGRAAIYPLCLFGFGAAWAMALAVGFAPPARRAPRLALLALALIADAGVGLWIMLLSHHVAQSR